MARGKIPKEYEGRKIYSMSRLSTFHTCEYAYYIQYVKGSRGKDNIYNLLGTEIHTCLEKLQFNEMTNAEALASFRDKVFELTEVLGYKFPSEKVRTNFVECIEHYLSNYKPIDCKEFKSEFEFYVEIEGHVIVGYIDGVIFNHNDEVWVLDYKTSTKYSAKDMEEHSKQLLMYAYALEQKYGIKVNKVFWVMAKYANITWQGKTKPRKMFCQRNEIVASLRSELKKDLRELGKEDYEIEIILDKAQEMNDMGLLPQSIQDKYTIGDGYVEYPLNDDTINELKKYVRETIACIESKSDNMGVWKPKDITEKTSFFCGTLCGHSQSCTYYQRFLSDNKDSFEPKSTSIDDEMSRLFG